MTAAQQDCLLVVPPVLPRAACVSITRSECAAVYTLRLLAERIVQLTEQIHDLGRIPDTITTHCPTLLTHRGIDPDNTATLLITAGDNPDRLHSIRQNHLPPA